MARRVATNATEVLGGLVDRVTFHNPENGFCVLRVKARGQRDLITVIGHAAMISAGEFVQASGAWVNDRTHGIQFRASFLKAIAPTTVEGIVCPLSMFGALFRNPGLGSARHWHPLSGYPRIPRAVSANRSQPVRVCSLAPLTTGAWTIANPAR